MKEHKYKQSPYKDFYSFYKEKCKSQNRISSLAKDSLVNDKKQLTGDLATELTDSVCVVLLL